MIGQQKLVVAGLPHLTHQVKVVNLPRLEQAFLQNSQNVCSFGALFTEKRAATRWYSKAVAVLRGLAVHLRQSPDLKQHQAIQRNDSVNVLQLLQDQTLTGVYQPNRSYPSSVTDAAQHANFIPQEFTSQINAAAFLLSKRVDYVVEYPQLMAFYLKQNQQYEHGQLQSRVVSDAPPYAVSYITCNKSPQGEQLIAQMNKVLEMVWQQSNYKSAMFYWMDEATKSRLESAYAEVQQQVLRRSEFAKQ